MDNGLAVILGGAIGVIGSWGTTGINVYFSRKKPDPAEAAAKVLLKDLLEMPDWRWRKLATLANVIGADEGTTRRLLIEAGARGSMRNGALWGLTSRNPIQKAPGDPLEDPWAPGEAHVGP